MTGLDFFVVAHWRSMSSLIGILLDVSASMRRNVGDGIDEQGGPWARSIFEVINNFIKHDVSSDNHVFAIGFGANRPGEEIFDIIGTLQQRPATLDLASSRRSVSWEQRDKRHAKKIKKAREKKRCAQLTECLEEEEAKTGDTAYPQPEVFSSQSIHLPCYFCPFSSPFRHSSKCNKNSTTLRSTLDLQCYKFAQEQKRS